MKTRLTSLEHLVLHELLLKMAAECEDAGVCCNCDCTHICPFAFSREGGGPDGEPWAYLDAIDKGVVIQEAKDAANYIMPCFRWRV